MEPKIIYSQWSTKSFVVGVLCGMFLGGVFLMFSKLSAFT